MARRSATTANMTVKIVMNDRGNPPGKLADAELHFTEGPLAGLTLIGFSVWERRSGAATSRFRRVSTAVMAADADFYAPPGLMKLLAAHLKHSTWALVPDAGHSVSWEQPMRLTRASWSS